MQNQSATQVGAVLGSVPLGDMLSAMAIGIADAQLHLDRSALITAEFMSGNTVLRDPNTLLPMDVNGNLPQFSHHQNEFITGTQVLDNGSPAFVDTAKTIPKMQRFEPLTQDTRVFFGRDENGTPLRYSMLELGFTPTFYQFVDTILEIKISVSMTQSVDGTEKDRIVTSSNDGGARALSGGNNRSVRKRTTVSTTSVDANYATKYNYDVQASSSFRTKLVPVPPPALLDQRIRQQMEFERQWLEKKLKAESGE